MNNIAEIMEGVKDPRNHYSPETEYFFLEWKVEQMKNIRSCAENSVTPQQIESLRHVMARMYFSDDLAERFPSIYNYEQTLFKYLNDKKEALLVKPTLPE